MIMGIGVIILLNQPVNYLIVKEVAKDEVIALKKLRQKDIVILSHINSIYDAEVKEIFEVRNNFLVLKDVDTSSWGVKEYYGIADGLPERRFSKIIFRIPVGGVLHLASMEKNVEKISECKDRSLLIEVKSIKYWKYYWEKLMMKLKKEVLP